MDRISGSELSSATLGIIAHDYYITRCKILNAGPKNLVISFANSSGKANFLAAHQNHFNHHYSVVFYFLQLDWPLPKYFQFYHKSKNGQWTFFFLQ